MKKISIPILILLVVFLTTIKSKAQKNDKTNKQVTIKIVTEEDGKKTVIDTTFTTADEADVEAFLRDKGISNSNNPPLPPLPPLPPNPPLPPAPPAPPTPPKPGMRNEPNRKYEYSYKNENDGDRDEIHISIDMDKIEQALEEADRQLEQAIKQSASLTKEEIKKIKKEVETSLKELKSEMKSNKKYIIIETTKKKSKLNEIESK